MENETFSPFFLSFRFEISSTLCSRNIFNASLSFMLFIFQKKPKRLLTSLLSVSWFYGLISRKEYKKRLVQNELDTHNEMQIGRSQADGGLFNIFQY
jgi:hypothetical protein